MFIKHSPCSRHELSNAQFLNIFTPPCVAMYNIVLAERAGSIYAQPLVNTGTMKMMSARDLPQLNSIIIWQQADATFLHQSQPQSSLYNFSMKKVRAHKVSFHYLHLLNNKITYSDQTECKFYFFAAYRIFPRNGPICQTVRRSNQTHHTSQCSTLLPTYFLIATISVLELELCQCIDVFLWCTFLIKCHHIHK